MAPPRQHPACSTRIIATMGPSSHDTRTLRAMARAGMSTARLNFSHGTHEWHQKMIATLRRVNQQHSCRVKILQDLEGYRIRVGILPEPLMLKRGQKIWLVPSRDAEGERNVLPLDADFEWGSLKSGMMIFIADGVIALRVLSNDGRRAKVVVESGGEVSSKKGVNIPQQRLHANILTAKDKEDIAFGIRHKVDAVALSFVRNRRDLQRVARMIRPNLPDCRLIAKIENKQGLKNLDGIIQEADAILVARGDLGVSLPIYKIPVIQKNIIQRCRNLRKPVIVATQMLESMLSSPRPTRAEVSDVANAIFEGAYEVMLSGETAIGQYPVEAVRMMQHIVEYTESSMRAS